MLDLCPLRRASACLLAACLLPAGAAAAAPAACENGFAGESLCDGVDFLAFVSLADLGAGAGTEAANVWGWTDRQSRREYVLLGLSDSTKFIDVTDPTAPILVGTLPTQTGSSRYRDVKVYRDHAFIIADLPSLHGMQVFDLRRLRNVGAVPATFTADTHFDGFGDAHNIYINQASGFAYVVRTTTPELCGGGMYMIDIREPLSPSFAGCVGGGLASDSVCVNYRGSDEDHRGDEICVVASDDDIIVADVSDKAAPQTLAVLDYPDVYRAHNAWFTASHDYFLSVDMNDELNTGANTRIFVWDVRDVDAPALIGIYDGPTAASDHNVWVRGNRAYVGNFRAGLRILDVSGITEGELVEHGYFDWIAGDDNPGHSGGAWAVYPFFPSRTIAVSDKGAGLYLLRARARPLLQVDYRYAMSDGDRGTGTYRLYDDDTFVDGAGASGTWRLWPMPGRIVLRYEDDASCAARSVGTFLGGGRTLGQRRCTDGSGVRGVWGGTMTAPQNTMTAPQKTSR